MLWKRKEKKYFKGFTFLLFDYLCANRRYHTYGTSNRTIVVFLRESEFFFN
jgi:hypothetical protein